MLQRIKTWLKDIDGSTWFYLSLFAVSLFFLRLTFWAHPDTSSDFWGNVRVEFVGFCFDVLLLGLIFSIFMQRYQRKQDVKHLKDEIEDFFGWHEKEATFRIIGNLKRLNRLGVTKFHLRNCFLVEGDFSIPTIEIENSSIWDSHLAGARFESCKQKDNHYLADFMQGIYFGNGDISNTVFEECNLSQARFNNVNLAGSKFLYCNLTEIDFEYSILQEVEFQDSTDLQYESISKSATLYQTKGIPYEILERIKNEHPELLLPMKKHPLHDFIEKYSKML